MVALATPCSRCGRAKSKSMGCPDKCKDYMTRQQREMLKEVDVLTNAKRGRLKMRVVYTDPDYVFAEITNGYRVARTPFSDTSEHAQLLHDALELLGFTVETTIAHEDYEITANKD